MLLKNAMWTVQCFYCPCPFLSLVEKKSLWCESQKTWSSSSLVLPLTGYVTSGRSHELSRPQLPHHQLTNDLFFLINLFFNGRIIALLNLLFSVKPQHESAIDIHMSPPSWTSLLLTDDLWGPFLLHIFIIKSRQRITCSSKDWKWDRRRWARERKPLATWLVWGRVWAPFCNKRLPCLEGHWTPQCWGLY